MTSIAIYQRDFSEKIPLSSELGLRVESYEWNMYGGPKLAIIKALATDDKWELAKSLLRCPVEITGSDGKKKWWGFINRVTTPQGLQSFGYSLDNMYNHVTVRYEQDGLTEAATNAVSVSEYGQKELVERSYSITGLEAAQLRGIKLEDSQYPKTEIELNAGSTEIEIECLGWYDTLRWKHYTNTTESNVANDTQISTIVTAVGQFINGTILEDSAGVTSNQARDARDGLSCVNELLQAGTNNSRPLLSFVDKNRYLHVHERTAAPPIGDVDYVMRDDGGLETLTGAPVLNEDCTVSKWVKAKGSPNDFSFFVESAKYDVEANKTTYRPAGAYEQRRLAKFIADVVTGDGPHVWPSLIPPNISPQEFSPFWVALGKENDDITAIRAVVWDSTTNRVYAAGDFSKLGGVVAENIAWLDMETGQWYALETSGAPASTNTVWSLGIIEGSKLYVGTQGAGVGCFWEYDLGTDTWTDLSAGTSGPVNAIAIDGTDVYLGGAFTEMPSSTDSNYISKWTGAAFSALDTGFTYSGGGSGGCYDIVISGGVLYAVGLFDDASGTAAANIAAWDGATWSALGSGTGNSTLAVEVFAGEVYASNGAAGQVRKWDGSAWTLVGTFTGASASIEGLQVSDDGLYLYAIGSFTAVNGETVGNSCYWDGGEWRGMNVGLAGATITNADWTMFNTYHPIAVGNFTTADGNPAKGIALYFVNIDDFLDFLTNTGGGMNSTPGGSDKSVQYNYLGRHGGDKDFLYDYVNNNIQLGAFTVPIAGTRTFHQIQEGASPASFLWAFAASYAGFLAFMKANGDSTTPTALLIDEVIGRIRARGHDGSGWSNTQAEVRFVTKEGWSVGNHGARLEFYTTPATSTTLTKHLVIDENGITLPERSTDAATPGTGEWTIYPKSGGVYIVDDAGSVTGPLGTGGGAWDGDITDIDETSSSDIGAAIADDDQGIIYDTSATAWVRFAWSRVKTYIQALTDTLYIAINGNVSQANMETLADGSDADSLHIHPQYMTDGDVTSEDNANDLYRMDAGGSSGFTATIASLPGGSTVMITPVSGYQTAIVPSSTSQLAKMRIYNTTRSDYALISNYTAGAPGTLVLTAAVLGTWQVGDTLNIASNTVSGLGLGWVDFEITSGPTGKSSLFLVATFNDTTPTNIVLRLHPYETFGAGKIRPVPAYANNVNTSFPLLKITSNMFSASWQSSGAATATVVLREAGYIN